ncbi:cyclin-dependent kinase 20-like [Daphnia pulex]|uniref:Cyclin-dependent kinase 20 n=1 Tax=Daphnia pulex TaxID=6669 RepID=E9H1D3_DAPPU|nr:cyclin-dependent kinase 20-like [Daphnia pulex]EFX74436.1 hypothetical protein DAPPUDRAFT_324412 [Daphnia pulex]|eukprot:EFX74436.1 hypothetical protein DAPPUDRAFT_324412 [Daphnia pulex]
MERYIVNGRIGEGAHGIVLKGIDKSTMKLVAMKRIALKNINEQGLPNSAVRELLALRLIRHEYVVNLVDYFPQGYSLVLVFEYLPIDLYEFLRSNSKPLPTSHVKSYMWMLASAVEYIHSLGIMHRDLKPANLLIGSRGELKVTDFGLCRTFNHSEKAQRLFTHQVASRWYRAPELLYGSRNYGPEVDLWAMGCIFGEMLKNSPLFPGENDIGQLCTVIQVLGTPDEENWPGVSALPDFHKISFTKTRKQISFKKILIDVDESSRTMLEQFLRYCPQSRITAKQFLEAKYFQEDPLMTAIEELPLPTEKSVNTATAEFVNWDWSSTHF